MSKLRKDAQVIVLAPLGAVWRWRVLGGKLVAETTAGDGRFAQVGGYQPPEVFLAGVAALTGCTTEDLRRAAEVFVPVEIEAGP